VNQVTFLWVWQIIEATSEDRGKLFTGVHAGIGSRSELAYISKHFSHVHAHTYFTYLHRHWHPHFTIYTLHIRHTYRQTLTYLRYNISFHTSAQTLAHTSTFAIHTHTHIAACVRHHQGSDSAVRATCGVLAAHAPCGLPSGAAARAPLCTAK
jgi:hypothetical protein